MAACSSAQRADAAEPVTVMLVLVLGLEGQVLVNITDQLYQETRQI